MEEHILNVICGKEAVKSWYKEGFDKTDEMVDNGEIDGSAATYAFDTEHDRSLAIEIMQQCDGWLDNAWDTNALSWIRPGAKCYTKANPKKTYVVKLVDGEDEGHAFKPDEVVTIESEDGSETLELIASGLIRPDDEKSDEKTLALQRRIHNIVASGIMSGFMKTIKSEYLCSVLGRMVSSKEDDDLFIKIEHAMRNVAERMLLDAAMSNN